MSLFTRFVRINIAMLIFVSSALADVPVELRNLVLTGDMNGRSDVDFTTKPNDPKSNVTAFVPKGTRGTVLEVHKLKKTNSFGIKLKVTDLSKNPSKDKRAVTKDQEVWVYFSSTKANWLKFKDIDGSVVQDPVIALTAQAKRDGEALPAVPGTIKKPELPTAEEVKRDAAMGEDPNDFGRSEITGTQGGFCMTYPCPNQNPSIHATNLDQVTNVTDALDSLSAKEPVKKAKEPPKTPPKPPAKNEAVPERPISRSPKTEQVNTPGKWGKFPEITEWENGKGSELATWGLKHKPGFQRLCYKAVKRYTLGTGLVSQYLPGAHARQGTDDLLKENENEIKKAEAKAKKTGKPLKLPEYEWVDVLNNPRYKGMIKSPTDAPHGAIIVSWNDQPSSSGDIQVRIGRGPKVGFVSDGWSRNTINNQPAGRRAAKKGHPYKMKSVMVKIRKPAGENL